MNNLRGSDPAEEETLYPSPQLPLQSRQTPSPISTNLKQNFLSPSVERPNLLDSDPYAAIRNGLPLQSHHINLIRTWSARKQVRFCIYRDKTILEQLRVHLMTKLKKETSKDLVEGREVGNNNRKRGKHITDQGKKRTNPYAGIGDKLLSHPSLLKLIEALPIDKQLHYYMRREKIIFENEIEWLIQREEEKIERLRRKLREMRLAEYKKQRDLKETKRRIGKEKKQEKRKLEAELKQEKMRMKENTAGSDLEGKSDTHTMQWFGSAWYPTFVSTFMQTFRSSFAYKKVNQMDDHIYDDDVCGEGKKNK